jgi:hypothetical protein
MKGGLMEDAELEAAFKILLPDGLTIENLRTAQRAAYGALLTEPLVAETEKKRLDWWNERGKYTRHRSIEGPKFGGQSAERVGKIVKVGSSSIQRALRVKRTDPEVFDRMLRGGYESLEEACREAGLPDTSGKRKGKAGSPRHAFKNHLTPLVRYLREWTEGSFNGMTPTEARRLLPTVREAHYALIEVERALEERATTSRALR